jgi:intracellular sulfur oxidation DsrE/DsrF family protein
MIGLKKCVIVLLAGFIGMQALAQTTPAAPSQSDFWQTPAIQGYGAMHPLPEAALQPDASKTHKAVFRVTEAAATPEGLNPSLAHVARAVNIFASAGVPLENLDFVVVIFGPAAPIILQNDYYRMRTGVDNPNLELIEMLQEAGVRLYVCGQAIPDNHMEYDWVNPLISISLSGVSDLIILQSEGYVLDPL